ncbi:hypothetical protein [Helicobacter marmotae]|uniref:Uncharacterized protein n=1 Tax=Helicobacter marmotae TaxID=152490 RepID=A0A3D8I872_9HELI|nr:hypothetical protein [Helicobacter marmotae]RDU60954.1 hypothetical protein CQA63_00115 [Helicobacter marmotae]
MALSPDSVFMLVSIFCVALFVLIVLLWLFGPTPKKKEYQIQEIPTKITIEEIMRTLDNPKSDLTHLREAVEKFFTHYNELELSDYRKKSFLFAVAVHKNTSTELIIRTEEELGVLNPDLKRELNKTLNRALDARKF